ncbi:hypothetical protein R1T43_04470 [Alteromonas sp. CI.11.F.A3]|uniref:hypothetical protein n=1 Tax=Alteromonas sp. CI.11.F.A3 TaxID=3079555 RepID=UPI002943AC65|nr:hypothetical protein [Alteromonas sp. CI.11.F.A3]WOI38296.1 hypothetical protein R1T43_04470 [Alteromonas sp. CI.11.F.A3]
MGNSSCHNDQQKPFFLHESDDDRHSDIIITSYEYIDKPTFTEWNMGYAGSTPIFTELLARLSQTEFEPTKLPPKQIYALLRHLSAHQQKV